jgi:hypothetical protein
MRTVPPVPKETSFESLRCPPQNYSVSIRKALSASATGLLNYTRRSTVMGLWSLVRDHEGKTTNASIVDLLFRRSPVRALVGHCEGV